MKEEGRGGRRGEDQHMSSYGAPLVVERSTHEGLTTNNSKGESRLYKRVWMARAEEVVMKDVERMNKERRIGDESVKECERESGMELK